MNQKGLANLLAIGLILGITVIILSATIVYQQNNEKLQENVNAVPLANGSSGGSATIGAALADGSLPTQCVTDTDCAFASTTKDYSECCPIPGCVDFGDSKWVVVNESSLDRFTREVQESRCAGVRCQDVQGPFCEQSQYTYKAVCQSGQCVKHNVTLNTYD
jgi:hypothetical protein